MLTVEEIKKRIIPVLMENNVRGAVLFGSYAKGTANEDSDVDLLVDCDLEGIDFIYLKYSILDALEIEKADVFDKSHIIANSVIDNEIKKYGILLYGNIFVNGWKTVSEMEMKRINAKLDIINQEMPG